MNELITSIQKNILKSQKSAKKALETEILSSETKLMLIGKKKAYEEILYFIESKYFHLIDGEFLNHTSAVNSNKTKVLKPQTAPDFNK
jgi:hypothetical protein